MDVSIHSLVIARTITAVQSRNQIASAPTRP